MSNQTGNSNHTDDFGIPPDYDEFAGENNSPQQDQQSQKKKSFAYTETTARAFLNGVKLLPTGKDDYVFELSLLSGGQGDKANYLYGSFYASKRLKRMAEILSHVNFEDAGIVCEVTILNLHAKPSHGENGRIFDNYKGFLVSLKIG